MDDPLCRMPKLHKEYQDGKNKKRGKLGDVDNPRAKKQSLVTGTNSTLARQDAVAPAPRQEALQQPQPQALQQPQPQQPQQPQQQAQARFVQSMMRNQQAMLRDQEQMFAMLFGAPGQLVANAQAPVDVEPAGPYTAAEAYQRPVVANEAEARERVNRLKQAVSDKGRLQANRAPEHLRGIAAVEEAERMYAPSIMSEQSPPPVVVKREQSPVVKRERSPVVKREAEPPVQSEPPPTKKRVEIDLTKDSD